MLIWIIDDEWENYQIEEKVLGEMLPGCTLKYSGLDFTQDLARFGAQADAVICQITVPMTAAVLEKLRQCKIISVYGTGYNNVDLAAAKRLNIAVGYIPGYCAKDIAEYVMGAVYYLNKGYGAYQNAIAEGKWGAGAVGRPLRRIARQSLLVIGYGRIGKAAGEQALRAGMRVYACDPYLSEEQANALGVVKTTMEKGLALADFVTVHSIYTKETEGLLSMREFRQMKPSAYLINTSRGPVVNQQDLVAAVEEGVIAGAVVDVLEKEPPIADEPILHTEGIIVTPHISYYSDEALYELQYRAARNVGLYLTNQAGADLAL